MSHVDPYGGVEPRGWRRPEQPPSPQGSRAAEYRDISPGRAWPAADDDTLVRARHTGAAPDRYAVPSYVSAAPSDGATAFPGRHPAPGRRPVDGRSAYPDGDDELAASEADVPTNPIGWPQVRPDRPTAVGHRDEPRPATEPAPSATEPAPAATDAGLEPPPRRRGPGRRRATRSGKPAGTGRAGRNLPAAIGVGLGLGTLVLVSLFLFRPAFLAVIAAAVTIGIWEMTRAVRTRGARPPIVPLVAGGLLMVGLAWWAGPDALSLGLLVTVLATLVWRLGDGPAGYQRDMVAATLIAVYVPFLGGFAALLAVLPDGDLRIVVTLAAVVLSDTGGYAAGVAFGRHPMAPTISPKKSWEGLAGSLTAAASGSALLLWLLLDVELWWGALFGLTISAAAVLGDLAESMIKRDLKIKDMSNLLPGHGGLMDRLDSILFAVPAGYLLLALIVPS